MALTDNTSQWMSNAKNNLREQTPTKEAFIEQIQKPTVDVQLTVR